MQSCSSCNTVPATVPAGVPAEVSTLAGKAPPKAVLKELLFLVAGKGSLAADNEFARDVLAPGRRARLATLIRLGAKLSVRDPDDKSTVLHHLAALDDAASVVFALQQGVDSAVRDDDKKTALFWAAKMPGRASAIAALVAAGADVTVRDEAGWTPLHETAWSGDAKTIDALVAAGAPPQITNEDGVTPLHLAARIANEKTVEALLRHGAQANAADRNAKTPLDEAREHDHHKVLKRLQASVDAGAVTDADPLEALRKLAARLGERSARSALDSGDYGYYQDEPDLDPDDLKDQYWHAVYKKNLQEAIAVLAPAERKKLPAARRLLDELFDVYVSSYEAALG